MVFGAVLLSSACSGRPVFGSKRSGAAGAGAGAARGPDGQAEAEATTVRPPPKPGGEGGAIGGGCCGIGRVAGPGVGVCISTDGANTVPHRLQLVDRIMLSWPQTGHARPSS